MKKLLNTSECDKIYNFLNDEKLEYFSCTIFNSNGGELFSYCNNIEWGEIYSKFYMLSPPVKKHIVSKIGGFLWWDEDLYDLETNKYIRARNDVCGTNMICTLIPQKNKVFGAISFGSKNGQNHLNDLMINKQEPMKDIFDSLLRIRN